MGPLEILGARLAPLPGIKFPVELTGIKAGLSCRPRRRGLGSPGDVHRRAGGGGRPGRRRGPGCRGGLGPVIALAFLPTLGRLAVDVAVFAGIDVVLSRPAALAAGRSGRPYRTGLPRLNLSWPGLGSGAGCLAGCTWAAGRVPWPLGRQVGLVAGAVIEVGPIRRAGHRMDDGPAVGPPWSGRRFGLITLLWMLLMLMLL